jgi:glycerol kinase
MTGTARERLFLALDQGGHASRALVFNQQGALIAKTLREVSVHSQSPGRVEQDPEELVSSLQQAAAEAVQSLGVRAEAIVSAGLATQRSSIVCWDKFTGAALSPVISWQDRRAQAWLASLTTQADEVHRLTGLRLSPHYGASKLRWCLDHLAPVKTALGQRRLAMGPLASFLLFRLLRKKSLFADPANAARMLLWNLHTADWDRQLLALFGIPGELLPPCVPTQYSFGTLDVGRQAIPLTIMTGDQSAALFAHGAPAPDAAYINLGTGAFVQRALGRLPDEAPGLLTSIVYRDARHTTYVLEGTVNGAGAALRWAEQELGLTDIDDQLPEWLARQTSPPLFLNGVSGLGAPFWVADFESRFIGGGEPWQKAVAVAESIVFLLQTNLEIMKQHAPPLARMVVTGGLALNTGLCQRLADLSGLPVYRPAELEATARGAAFLLAGFPDSWPEEISGTWFRPVANPALHKRYKNWRDEMSRAVATR